MGSPRWVLWLWGNYGIKLQPTYDKIKNYQPSPEIKSLLDNAWSGLLEAAKKGGPELVRAILELIKKELNKNLLDFLLNLFLYNRKFLAHLLYFSI